MQVRREHIVEALRRAGLWDEAHKAETLLPEAAELEEMAQRCAAVITREQLVNLMGGSP
jgi:chaperonin GroEL (HSP60 family)